MDKALSYMAIARKAGRIELGEEPAGAAAQTGKASLLLVAKDASDHTWRKAKHFVSGTAIPCIRVMHTKAQLGQAFGRDMLALAAFTDPALAIAFLKALPPEDASVAAALEAMQTKGRKATEKQGFRSRKQGRSRPAAK